MSFSAKVKEELAKKIADIIWNRVDLFYYAQVWTCTLVKMKIYGIINIVRIVTKTKTTAHPKIGIQTSENTLPVNNIPKKYTKKLNV